MSPMATAHTSGPPGLELWVFRGLRGLVLITSAPKADQEAVLKSARLTKVDAERQRIFTHLIRHRQNGGENSELRVLEA